MPITQAEVQALFNRFGAPLATYALSSSERKGGAEVMVKALWTALIAGPEAEEVVWRIFTERAHLAAEDLQAIKDCYYQIMKPVIGEKDLAALREQYMVKKKSPE